MTLLRSGALLDGPLPSISVDKLLLTIWKQKRVKLDGRVAGSVTERHHSIALHRYTWRWCNALTSEG
jgi:hypothetical protein